MAWLTDEILFYGGMAVAGCALAGALIFLCISQIRLARLNARMDAEYGEEDSRRSGRKR